MNIEWSKLESCGGSATRIPDAINLLFSTNKRDRAKGYWGIDNPAVLQSELYSSAPYAARVIVDRYLNERVLTSEIVKILFELRNAHGPQLLFA